MLKIMNGLVKINTEGVFSRMDNYDQGPKPKSQEDEKTDSIKPGLFQSESIQCMEWSS